jgi:hypothetical protein
MSDATETAVWNRAATREGGDKAGVGDGALSAVLKLNAAVEDGGFSRALEVLTRADFEEAAEGFEYFGATALRELVLEASDLDEPTDDDEHEPDELLTDDEEDNRDQVLEDLDDRYGDLLPEDTSLGELFETRYREHPEDFAPVV